MSIGKVFTETDLITQGTDDIVPGNGGDIDTDVLSKINDFVSNIDSLMTHLSDIAEKHPEILAKLANLTGKRQFAPGGGKGNPGQYSPEHQPQGQNSADLTSKNVKPEKLYTVLLGIFHSFEGKGLTVEDAKKLIISQKAFVLKEIEKALPSLIED